MREMRIADEGHAERDERQASRRQAKRSGETDPAPTGVA